MAEGREVKRGGVLELGLDGIDLREQGLDGVPQVRAVVLLDEGLGLDLELPWWALSELRRNHLIY